MAAGIFTIAAITDKLDGYIARKYNQVTKLGIFFDPLVDKLLIIGALVFLVQIHRTPWWVALIIIGREFAVTGFRLIAAQRGLVLAADKSGKIKMLFQVIAIIMTMLNNFPLSMISSYRFDTLVMAAAVVLTVYSGINYLKTNWHVFDEDTV
jgi:CDP-diacylglycerol--glycerol-3-phosphate 3-phosphatidyltransferase